MTLTLLNGEISDTPVALTDKIRVSVPDRRTATRQVYGPLAFVPVVSGQGGTRIPQAGDKAVVAVDEGSGEQWVAFWYRADNTPPPYSEAGGGGGGSDKNFVFTQSSPSITWVVPHNLNKFVAVSVVDSGGTAVIPDVHFDSVSQVTLTFGSATSGKVYLN